MMTIIMIILITALILSIGYIYRKELKQIWDKHSKKLIAFALASSMAAGGLVGIPDLELSINDYLIDEVSDYADLGFDVSKIENPIIYEREVLCEGHLPLAFEFSTLSKDVSVKEDFITISKSMEKNIGNLDLTYKTLVKETFTYEVPVYKTAYRDIEIFSNKTMQNETVKEEYEVLDYYDEVEDYKYVWKEFNPKTLTQGDIVVVDIIGNFKASTISKEVDIIPTLNLDSYSKTYEKYAWWNSNWDYKKEITLNSSQVPSTLSNFPVCIDITDTDLRDNAQSDGDDIAFTNSAEDTQLNHEIEYWDNTTGELIAWVNVTSLAHDADTDIYMYYGNDAASNQENPSLVWNFSSPDLSSNEHTIEGSFDGAQSVYATDVDGDGDIDVLGAARGDEDITWWENDGSEGFTEHTIDGSFDGAQSVYATDVDGDGDIDVLGAAYSGDDITWWENDGSEGFTEHTIDAAFDGAYFIYATDVDGDGDIDVLGAAYLGDDITWWENDGSEGFTKHTIDASFNAAASVYATDVDGDGDIDVLGAAYLGDDITWWENDGSEGFTEHTIDAAFDGARSVYATDVDGDGDIDVLGAAYLGDDITWWENDGSEGFTKHTIDASFNGAASVYATDVDGDGDIDVLGAARNDKDITWWENDGSEGFTEHTIEGSFDGAQSVYATDVDGDGDIDVLGAARDDNDITWWESSASPGSTDADWRTTYQNTLNNALDGGFFSLGSEETESSIKILNPVPDNGDTGVETKPRCNFTAVNDEGTAMDVTWKDDSYSTLQTNNSVANNTNVVLSELSYAWHANTEYTFHINVTDGTNWKNNTITFTTKSYYYNETIRVDGIDYFTWMDNESISASNLKSKISGLDTSSEYIQVWKADSWDTNAWLWETYFGDDSGTDFTVNEFDVVRVLLDDSGTVDIEMVRDADDINGRTVYLNDTSTNRGYNYTSYANETTEYIGTIASNIGLDTGEVISWWDDSNYEWAGYIVGISPPAYNITVSGRAIFETKVETNKVWNIP